MKTVAKRVMDFIDSDSPWFLVAFTAVIVAEVAIMAIFFPPR